MALRTLTTVPPGGWRLTETLPDGSTKTWHSMNFVWELAEKIADFRKGNGLPRATAKEALLDIENATCARLHDDPQWCVKKKAPERAPAHAHPSRSARAAAADGGRILVDWLGDGAKPVAIALAHARAGVCFTCPHNKEGHRWLRLTAQAVRAIAEQMNAKERLKLRVDGEEKLHACDVCACPLPLKVHVPLPTILAHTDADTLAAMPAYCWMNTERQRL